MSKALPMGQRALFMVSGPDALRYLNGQVSQDVRRLNEPANQDVALPACVTDAKGRLQALVHVFGRADGSIWVEGPGELEEELELRLGRYLISDDAEIENVSAEWELWHVVDCPQVPEELVRRSKRLGAEGYDLWLLPGEFCGIPLLSEAEAEARRIAAKVPAWGKELTPGMLPPEAGLDREAISYHKGCYIGQEVLSRIKSAGKVNRRLEGFSVEAGVSEGDVLLNAEGKDAGVITSVSPLVDGETGRFRALGFVGKAGFRVEEFSVEGKGRVRVG
ncbi:folate-binding protein YgfZ [Luteolibacter sp. Populi]|uniref:CAF17-like 4Fe-4S cluster assembly/insertion protein YgfZ n=1 Tax=Luteolibacter sp. Populi TaxID=3230487 RepID=UPI0034666CCF